MEQVIVGLDIGTTKIACFIGKKGSVRGKAQIIGYGRTDSVGVEHGVVINIMQTADSIRRAVRMASEQADYEVSEVYVGVAGQHIKSLKSSGSTMVPEDHRLILQEDVDRLRDEQNRLIMGVGDEIIHVMPQNYIVDNEPLPNEISPVGVPGKCLKANFHIITGNTTNLNNIKLSIEEAGLKVKGLVLEPIASALAVLDDRDKGAGVALVDVGGGTTDVAIFTDGNIRHTSVLPLAGNSITEDIRRGCNILKTQAESLKTKFGSCLPSNVSEDEVISIPGIRNQPSREISRKRLAGIINSRVKMILEQVEYEFQLAECKDELHAPIALTGGGSKLQHFSELCSLMTGVDSRIGSPIEHLEQAQAVAGSNLRPPKLAEIDHPMYATVIGLVLYGLAMVDDTNASAPEVEAEPAQAPQNIKEEDKTQPASRNTDDIFAGLDDLHPEPPVVVPAPSPVVPESKEEPSDRKEKKPRIGHHLQEYFKRFLTDDDADE